MGAGAGAYVASLALPPPPEDEQGYPFPVPESTDAAVVGNAIVTVSPELDEDERKGVMNALLLAQLAAKRVADANDAAWYATYFDVLQHIGFNTLATEFFDHQIKGTQVEVHEIVLEVAAAFLGETSQAFVIVRRTLEFLEKRARDAKASWITIFERDARSERQCRFQVVSVEKQSETLVVSLMAYVCELTASSTQVLFVKVGEKGARLAVHRGQLSLDTAIYDAALRSALAVRVSAYIAENIAHIPI